MRVFGFLFALLSLPVLAAEYTTQIYDIDYGTKPDDEVLVLLTSGHVAKLRESHEILNKKFMKSELRKNWYRVTLDKDRYIVDLDEVDPPYDTTTVEGLSGQPKILFNQDAPMSYVPTTIASMELAKKYHKEARHSPKDSQCFNRGMVWTYEMWKKHSVKSKKIWLYFTRTYIRRYNFEWWFHISPLVNVMDNGKVVERAMDAKYSSGPLPIQRWTNIFMRNDAVCRVIYKFSDYADHPYTGDCYIQRSDMYVYQPADLQMYEAWGYQKTNWNMNEVRAAYLEAFDIRL